MYFAYFAFIAYKAYFSKFRTGVIAKLIPFLNSYFERKKHILAKYAKKGGGSYSAYFFRFLFIYSTEKGGVCCEKVSLCVCFAYSAYSAFSAYDVHCA